MVIFSILILRVIIFVKGLPFFFVMNLTVILFLLKKLKKGEFLKPKLNVMIKCSIFTMCMHLML